MDVHGFHIVSEPNDQNESGFSTTVINATGAVRGPFKTIKEAVDCAHAWNGENSPCELKQTANSTPIQQSESDGQTPSTENK